MVDMASNPSLVNNNNTTYYRYRHSIVNFLRPSSSKTKKSPLDRPLDMLCSFWTALIYASKLLTSYFHLRLDSRSRVSGRWRLVPLPTSHRPMEHTLNPMEELNSPLLRLTLSFLPIPHHPSLPPTACPSTPLSSIFLHGCKLVFPLLGS